MVVLCLLTCILFYNSCVAFTPPAQTLPSKEQSQQTFIVPEQSRIRSKTALKERIGKNVETILNTCASLNNTLGKVLKSLAVLQTRMLEVVKNVLKNRRPIKRSNVNDLQQGINVLQNTAVQLEKIQNEMKKMCNTMARTTVLKRKS